MLIMCWQIADAERRLRSRNFEIEVLETRVRISSRKCFSCLIRSALHTAVSTDEGEVG